MGDLYFDIPVEIVTPLSRRMFEVFKIYDHRNINMVEGKDVGDILRALGCVPTEAEIAELISLTEFPQHPGDVHFSNFYPVLKTWLIQHKMTPSPPEDLLRAFKVFDDKNRGYIKKNDFTEILKEFGEEVTQEDIEDILKSSVEPLNDKIYYETYLNQLVHEPEYSIYKIADELAAIGQRRSEIRFKMLMNQMQKK